MDEECCLDRAEWQYCELKGGKDVLRSGSVGGDGWSWDAAMHSGQKHSNPAFLEWQEPGSPCGWCGECTAYGNKGGLFSFPLSLASLKIKESTRKDLGMFANLLVSVVEIEASASFVVSACSPRDCGQRSGAEGAQPLLK